MISIKFRPWPVLTLAAILSLALLIVLGQWQWARYQDKRLLKATPPPIAALGPILDTPGGVVFLNGAWDGKTGWRIIRAVRIGAAPNIETVLVDTGFAFGVTPPDAAALGADPAAGLAPGMTLAGLWHTPSAPSAFAAKPDGRRSAFYAWDLDAMGQTLALAAPRREVFLLPYVGADGKAAANPFSGHADPLPPERHLGYALTWWGLAAALIGVYFVYHAQAGRLLLRRQA